MATYTGDDSNETIQGTADADSLSGAGGDDRFEISRNGEAGNDTVDGGTGWDTVVYDYGTQSEPVNFVGTAESGTQAEPDGSTDQLTGIEEVQVFGGGGNDTIVGDGLRNFLEGNSGDDSLTGGVGDDMFAWDFNNTSLGTDRITDFTAGDDVLHFRWFNLTSVVEGSDPSGLLEGQLMVNTGAETTLYVLASGGALTTIVLEGNFAASDFRLDNHEWGTNVSLSLPATEGDDFLQGGSTDDVIDGLGGNDNIHPGAGNDTVYGGAGNDYISAGGQWHPGSDVIDGGEGFDQVVYDYSQETTGVSFTATGTTGSQFDPFDGSTDTLTNVEQVSAYGGSGDDTFVGDGMANNFQGNGGNDTLTGGGGNDGFSFRNDGPNGHDRITDAGTGDWLWFNGLEITGPIQQGDDPSGLAVGEVMVGTPADGVTLLYVRTADGADGLATIELVGEFSRSSFAIHANLPYGTSLNIFQPTSGNDGFWGAGGGHEYFDGGAGNDSFGGSDGNDTLIGGAGSDFFSGGAGDDVIDGGEITDRINYTDLNSISYAGAAGPIQLDLQSGQVVKANGTDTVSNVNFVTGTAHNDVLIGSDDATMFERFDGGLGDDTIDGGAGANRVDYANAAATGGITVLLTEGVDGVVTGTATGGMGNDTLVNINNVHGTRFADSITGSATTGSIEGFAGRGGNDTIDGGDGMDHARYDSAGEAVTINLAEGWAEDGERIAGVVGVDELIGIESVRGSRYNDSIVGSDAGADGLDHNGDGQVDYEYFIGMAGNDTIDGGGGRDMVYYTTSAIGVHVSLLEGKALDDGYGNQDTLIDIDGVRGSSFGDHLVGDANGNRLEGMDGEDLLEGGGGDDYLDGGTQPDGPGIYDIADYRNAGGGVTVDLAAGTATGAAGNDTLVGVEAVMGSSQADVLVGNTGDNAFLGGAGNDDIDGGDGRDLVAYEDTESTMGPAAGVQVDLALGTASDGDGGTDTLAGLEDVSGTRHADTLAGDDGDNQLDGLGGNDLLQGAAGNDTLLGDDGDDTLGGGAGADLLDGGAGFDTVSFGQAAAGVIVNLATGEASGGDTLVGIEGIIGSDHADTLTGNNTANVINGRGGVDTMAGGAGNDTYYVDEAADVVNEGAGAGTDEVRASASYTLAANLEKLTLIGTAAINGTGNALANVLTGNGAANVLNGGTGADSMSGGAGNDTYVVDNARDRVTESNTGGVDTVNASVTHTLAGFVENLTLTGTAAINGTGNTLANTLTGNSGANVLNGGTGADKMAGGAGNDTYVVDNAGDRVTETSTGGADKVNASVTHTLANYVENLTLTGTAAINGTGNTLANVITGNSGANVLNGGAGADKMAGGAGNDTYVVDNAGDVVTETGTGGVDKVNAAVTHTLANYVENLTLTGSAAISGTGNTLANVITGNSGANVLNGGAGKDTLTGGGGADKFAFTTATHSTSAAFDIVKDFVRGTDKILLSTFDANTALSGQQDFKFIGTAAFGSNATGQLRIQTVGGKLMLYGSTDADATAEFAVQILGTTTLTASDILL